MNLALKNKALILRKKGKSYAEIQLILGNIPKSTLSGWLKNIILTPEQKNKIIQKIKNGAAVGRQKGSWVNKQKRINRINLLRQQAKDEFATHQNNPLFFIGLALYMAEGSKKSERFMFMNSDPRLIKLMIKWTESICSIPRSKLMVRLYIHKIYKDEKCESFWSKQTGIPKSQFSKTTYKDTIHRVKKNPNYKGCLRVEARSSDWYWKVMCWGDMMSRIFT